MFRKNYNKMKFIKNLSLLLFFAIFATSCSVTHEFVADSFKMQDDYGETTVKHTVYIAIEDQRLYVTTPNWDERLEYEFYDYDNRTAYYSGVNGTQGYCYVTRINNNQISVREVPLAGAVRIILANK